MSDQAAHGPLSKDSQLDYLVQRKWFIQAKDGEIQDKYNFQERIGSGTFGLVYRVTDPQDGKLIWRKYCHVC